jgi:hypothetical protein
MALSYTCPNPIVPPISPQPRSEEIINWRDKSIHVTGNVHYLKSESELFQEVKTGGRNFDVRKEDRSFEVGDTLIINEVDRIKGTDTGNWTAKLVSFVFKNAELVKDGYVVLGIQDIKV